MLVSSRDWSPMERWVYKTPLQPRRMKELSSSVFHYPLTPFLSVVMGKQSRRAILREWNSLSQSHVGPVYQKGTLLPVPQAHAGKNNLQALATNQHGPVGQVHPVSASSHPSCWGTRDTERGCSGCMKPGWLQLQAARCFAAANRGHPACVLLTSSWRNPAACCNATQSDICAPRTEPPRKKHIKQRKPCSLGTLLDCTHNKL